MLAALASLGPVTEIAHAVHQSQADPGVFLGWVRVPGGRDLSFSDHWDMKASQA
jgi:hypothetical protein